MSWFQIIGVSVLGLLVVASAISVIKRPGRALPSLVWIAVWIAAALAIMFPDSTTAIAQTVGIQRGADLVAYCGILAGMIGFFVVYLRLRQVSRQMTLIVRQLSLQNPQLPAPRVPDDDRGGS